MSRVSHSGRSTERKEDVTMSWLRWLLPEELAQSLRIHEQRDDLARLGRQVADKERHIRSIQQTLRETQDDNDRLERRLAALVEVVVARNVMERDEIERACDTIIAADENRTVVDESRTKLRMFTLRDDLSADEDVRSA
jgi:uncharacterized coiled-coil protein SlyX